MNILWRLNPRKLRVPLLSQLVSRANNGNIDEVSTDAYFGLVGDVSAGQGSATSDISASAAASAAAVTTGQGSITSDIAGGISTDATADTGQGSATSDGIGHVPFVATVETGAGEQTIDAIFGMTAFQQIKPKGFFDNGIITPDGERSLWRLNPRLVNNFFSTFVLRNPGDALPDITDDVFFTDTTYDGVGTQDVAFGVIHVSPTGIASTAAFGAAYVYNYNQLTYPTGISSTLAFGTPRVENYFRYLYPTGLASSNAFGTTTIANLNRELTLSGINSAAYGMAHIYDPAQFARLVGFDWLTWGTASIINNNRYLSPTGTKFDVIGTQHVENSLRYLYAQRIDPKGFGTATIYNLTQYKTMTGFKDDVFGTAYIIGPRYLRPTGWKSDKFLPTNAVSNYYRTVYPTGVPAAFPVTGSATIYNKAAFIFPDSVDPEDMPGAIVAMPPFDIIDVTGNSISESEVTSEADIYFANANHLYLRSGIYTGAVGTPTLTPAMITINAGILGSGYGRPTVSNYTRYVIPSSIGDASRYGTQWASHYIRYVEPRGWDSSVVWYAFGPINLDGTIPGVKGSAVYLYPTGFDASGTTYDPCGFPRTPPIPRPSVHP